MKKNESLITINIIDVSCQLAHISAFEDMKREGLIDNEDEMICNADDEEDVAIYTEKAQDVFNDWYDFYYDLIEKCEIK